MSKNAFADIGFSDADAADMALRVAVAAQIRRVISQRELSQNEAKKLFGVPQPTISKINRLRLSGLSLSLLLRMLFKAGIPFQLTSGGNSQSVSAAVGRQPEGSAVAETNWPISRDLAGQPTRTILTRDSDQTDRPQVQPWPPEQHMVN